MPCVTCGFFVHPRFLRAGGAVLQGAGSLFKHTDLSECITGVVMVKIWGGVTVLMRSWGKPEDKEMGLSQVEEGVGYALTRPGLMTFPMWCVSCFGGQAFQRRLWAL